MGFLKEESGLDSIPIQYQNKVLSYAYENAHSEGFRGIYNALIDLVDIFKN